MVSGLSSTLAIKRCLAASNLSICLRPLNSFNSGVLMEFMAEKAFNNVLILRSFTSLSTSGAWITLNCRVCELLAVGLKRNLVKKVV